jgi:hypothetical protein
LAGEIARMMQLGYKKKYRTIVMHNIYAHNIKDSSSITFTKEKRTRQNTKITINVNWCMLKYRGKTGLICWKKFSVCA